MFKRSYMLMATLSVVGCGENSISQSWYRPTIDTTWHWQLNGELNSSYGVDVYDIDLFDTPKETIDRLHRDGKRIICYFSAGSFENWRVDSYKFPYDTLGEELDGWDGERWLDIRDRRVREIMRSRLDLAKSKGCDAVEPDNMDGYTNSTGFNLTYQDQLKYNIFIADEVHKRGLSVALKNDFEQIEELEPYFDFAVSESCFEYGECSQLIPFIESSKAVFEVEYGEEYISDIEARDDLCERSRELNFQTLILPIELDGSFRYSCN